MLSSAALGISATRFESGLQLTVVIPPYCSSRPCRGIAFEGAIHRDMGNLEVQDQNAAVAYFAKRGLIDPTRVGTLLMCAVKASYAWILRVKYLVVRDHEVSKLYHR